MQKNLLVEENYPDDMKREIRILYEMGLPKEDIEYLVFLRYKLQARNKWN
ncbi:hypothetical protein HYW76_00620 [Candidatus Pacearchaeota archaeon]|nr:hypothetical protein [Candidatus Pacearchaeota archaeon]